MADALTAIYELTKPEVGASANTWGTKLNTSEDTLDLVISRPRIQRASPTVGATTVIDAAAALVAKFTVTQVTTVSVTGWAVDTTPGKWAQRVLAVITNGGAFAVTWSGVTWLSGVAPTLQAAGADIVELMTVDNGVTVFGVHHGVVDTIRANLIVTAMIADAQITNAKLVDATILPAKLSGRERVKATKNANQALSAGVEAAVSWDGADAFDSASLHDPASNPTRITIPASWVGSVVLLHANIWLDQLGGGGTDGAVQVVWKRNGSAVIGRSTASGADNGIAPFRVELLAFEDGPVQNDYYEVFVTASEAGRSVVTGASATVIRLW